MAAGGITSVKKKRQLVARRVLIRALYVNNLKTCVSNCDCILIMLLSITERKFTVRMTFREAFGCLTYRNNDPVELVAP